MSRREHLQVWKRWVLWLVPGLLVFSTTVAGPLAMPRWVNEVVLFWFVMVVTVLCATGAAIVVVVGWRRRLAEVAVLGAVLWSTSTLPMVHGLTTPGVLYDAHHAAFELAAFVAVPIGLVIGLPVLFAGTPVGRVLGTVWRQWVVISVTLVSAIVIALLIEPDAIAAPSVRSPIALAGIALSIGGTLVLSLRHLRLYRIGRRSASLATSVGFVYLGLSSLAFVVETTWSFAFWSAHVADAIGVFAALFGLYFAHRHDRSLAVLLAPVVNSDPVIALELGLTPVVVDRQRFEDCVEVHLLMESGTDIGGGDLTGDCKDRNMAGLGVEQPVDQVERTWPHGAGADSDPTGDLAFGPRGFHGPLRSDCRIGSALRSGRTQSRPTYCRHGESFRLGFRTWTAIRTI